MQKQVLHLSLSLSLSLPHKHTLTHTQKNGAASSSLSTFQLIQTVGNKGLQDRGGEREKERGKDKVGEDGRV